MFQLWKNGPQCKGLSAAKETDDASRGWKLFLLPPARQFQARLSNDCVEICESNGPSTINQNSCKKIEYITTREVYIELVIAGRTCSCLLDSGSDVTLFPHVLVRGLPLDQCAVYLSAANGTSIPILGAVAVTAKRQGRNIEIDGLVTDHVNEVILGINWLQANGADWNFKTRKLTVDGQVYQLVDERKRAHCRILVLQEPVTLPARSQLDVPTMVVDLQFYLGRW